MKLFLKLSVVVLISSLISLQARSQGSVDPSTAPESAAYFSFLDLVHFTKNLGLLTDKFENADGASVLFDAKSIELAIHKNAAHCDPEQVCPQLVPAPVLISLKVQKVVAGKCSDFYYARTDESEKSTELEQIVLENRDVGRCPKLIAEKGQLLYRISGPASTTNQRGVAQIHFSLRSVKAIAPTAKPE